MPTPEDTSAETKLSEAQDAAAEAAAKAEQEAAEAAAAKEEADRQQAEAEAAEEAAKAAEEAAKAAAEAAAAEEASKGKKQDLETRLRKAKAGDKIKLPANSGVIASPSTRYMVDITTRVRYEQNFAIPTESVVAGSWLHAQLVAGLLLVTPLADVKG